MQLNAPFSWVGVTVSAAVTTSSAALALPVSPGCSSIRIVVLGTQSPIFIQLGASNITVAVASGIPLLAGVIEVFAWGSNCTHVAAIAEATGSTIYATLGYGN